MSIDLELFERELEDAVDWRYAFRVALDGLVNNAFTRRLREIGETDLPTLEVGDPDAYATIKDRKTREALIASGLFQIARERGSRAVEDLEIRWDSRIDSQRLLCAVEALAASRDPATPPESGLEGPHYAGGEAVKVFLRALDAVIEEIDECDWENFDILHRIAHQSKRRYGTPLDEIRICSTGLLPSLAKALEVVGHKETQT